MQQHKIITIANYFIQQSKTKPYKIRDLTALKINKLAVIAYGAALKYNIKLFNDDIQIWYRGPVVPVLYHEFKDYHAKRIKKLAYVTNFQEDVIWNLGPPPTNFSYSEKRVLDVIWDKYYEWSGLALRDKIESCREKNDEYLKQYFINAFFD